MSDEIEIIDSVDEIDRSGNTDIAVADQEDFDIEIVGRL
jgi:hypothetical protein